MGEASLPSNGPYQKHGVEWATAVLAQERRQANTNLIDNAIKYACAGSRVEAAIECRRGA